MFDETRQAFTVTQARRLRAERLEVIADHLIQRAGPRVARSVGFGRTSHAARHSQAVPRAHPSEFQGNPGPAEERTQLLTPPACLRRQVLPPVGFIGGRHDVKGLFLVQGLNDLHVHFRQQRGDDFELYRDSDAAAVIRGIEKPGKLLDGSITAVRDAATRGEVALAIKEAVEPARLLEEPAQAGVGRGPSVALFREPGDGTVVDHLPARVAPCRVDDLAGLQSLRVAAAVRA